MMTIARMTGLWAAFGCLAFIGCGDSGPELGQISGTVTVDGQPVEGLQVEFQPEQGRPAMGFTDQQGHYTVEYTAGRAGAMLGPHQVRISVPAGSQVPVKIPAKYNSRTELTAQVEPGSNQFDFQLSTK